ncbi:hypothetical protein AB5I41_14115 [Sphingomonas sp. MMS24-JH45]
MGKKLGNTPVPIGSDIVQMLLPAVTGRKQSEWLLERTQKKRRAGGIMWEADGRGPWKSASELSRPWRAVRDRAGIRSALVSYALRHSSIIRGLRANVPIRLVAATHDTSVGMIERNYGRYIADGLEELAARAVVSLIDD